LTTVIGIYPKDFFMQKTSIFDFTINKITMRKITVLLGAAILLGTASYAGDGAKKDCCKGKKEACCAKGKKEACCKKEDKKTTASKDSKTTAAKK
jgi:hypothetical protein